MGRQIAIDGPAGAGKSTIARSLAKKLGYIYVDTGAMYRAMALYLLRKGIAADETEKIEAACGDADISIVFADGEQQVLLNGENVNGLIRTEEVGNMASASSVNPKVRAKMTELQRKLGEDADVVMDGRDIGTFVLPKADVKIYLTASVAERARRRALEYEQKGMTVDVGKIAADIEERDYRDMHREHAPLRQAEDAILVDSSDMTIEQVEARLLELCSAKKDGKNDFFA